MGHLRQGAPGIVSFSGLSSFPFQFRQKRLTNFAADLGGVVEFYPSKRIVTRFEAGDTLIHYGQRQTNFFSVDPTTGDLFLVPFTTRSETRHNFQFAAGVGWRF